MINIWEILKRRLYEKSGILSKGGKENGFCNIIKRCKDATTWIWCLSGGT